MDRNVEQKGELRLEAAIVGKNADTAGPRMMPAD